MKRIVLTGGGSAGHVTPNLALIPKLLEDEWVIDYIGSYEGIEKELIKNKTSITYHSISTGKLRRYFSLKNVTDIFRVVKGITKSVVLLKRIKPNVVFSKGGFVSVPVTVAAWLNRIPVIIHESDMTPGLANRLSLPFATKVCATFPESMKHLPSEKAILTGNPIRQEVLIGSRDKGLAFLGFTKEKPVLLVVGGSLGSVIINKYIRAILSQLLEKFQVAHICGKGNLEPALQNKKGYSQYEFITTELPAILAASDIMVSRAGSNFLFELLALKKPNLLIPLSKKASRGDQILNAKSFEKQGFSRLIEEEDLTEEALLKSVNQLYENRNNIVKAIEESTIKDSINLIIEQFNQFV